MSSDPFTSCSSEPLFAYVWLIFGGNFYIPGVLPSAYSVKKTETKHDLVLMYIDGELTHQELDLLSTIFTKLVKVPYLQYKSKRMKTAKQQEMYGDWIDKSYTKANCLNLTEYKKVLFMDADTIVLKNMDHLFDMTAPAGTFSSPWGDRYRGYIPLGMYPKDHDKNVSLHMIDKAVTSGGVVAIGTTMLLEPNRKDFDDYTAYVYSNQPFGFPKCNSGFDEQSITYFFSKIKGVMWKHIHQQYNFIPWKHNWLSGETPYVYHFFNKEKPWLLDPVEYTDLKVYYQTVSDMISEYKIPEFEKYVPYLRENLSYNESIVEGGIRIVVKQKKGGIYTDALVLQKAITKSHSDVKCYITTDFGEMNKTDINIFVEHCMTSTEYLPSKENWLLVNPEFITEWDLKELGKSISKVLCKTLNAVEIMTLIKSKTVSEFTIEYIKFTTPDISQSTTLKDYNIVVHMAGSSFMKGTYDLLKSWVKYNLESDYILIISRSDGPGDKEYLQYWNELSPVRIVEWNGIVIDGEQYRNIIFTKYLDQHEKEKLYSIAGIFMCPSVAEGYGHYINEGRLSGSIVVTTDSAPMNELIDNYSGILIPVQYKLPIKSYIPWMKFLSSESKAAFVDKDEIIGRLLSVGKLSIQEKIEIGKRSRERYDEDTLFFEKIIGELFKSSK